MMNEAIQKALTFVLFIFIGVLLKAKFKNTDEMSGIKKIILNLALPTTIFLALIEMEIAYEFLLLPFLALALNVILFFITPVILAIIGISNDSPKARTAKLLLPSLAPGLSSFPLVAEFLGNEALSKAAMADLGNKFFVLIILYMIAMSWSYTNQGNIKPVSGKHKLRNLGLALIKEPVNLFIFAALIFVGLGWHLQDLPSFLENTFIRLSALMTPLVLLFIGLAVKLNKKQFADVFSILMMRSAVVLLLVGMLSLVISISSDTLLLILAFGLSACSFWPYAHISAVLVNEIEVQEIKRTFHADFGIGILALSLPLSTVLILLILSSGNVFTSSYVLIVASFCLILIGFIPVIIKKWSLLKTLQKPEFSEGS